MNKKISFVLAAVLCAACMGLATTQQEDKTPKPGLFLISIAHVKPAMTEQYEGALKELISELADYTIDPSKVNFHTLFGPELGYVFVRPMENFGSMESMRQNWEEATRSIGQERFETLFATINATVESRERIHTVHRSELSYTPENQALKPEDVKFINYSFIYVTPGTEETFEQVAKEYVAIYKEHNIDAGWEVYQSVTGQDLPLFVIIEPGKSRAEFAAQEERTQAMLAEHTAELGKKAQSCIRRVERKEAYPRPDLSYPTPETE